MLTLSWRRAGASSALALALVVGLPALAQAQLFPNLWIQRERTPCPNEPPFYANIRQNYYGYYPTCWRKFPEGWACPCPNPELPDASASFRAQPRDPRPPLPPREEDFNDRGGAPSDRGGAAPDAGRRGVDAGDMPPLPRSEQLGAPLGRPDGGNLAPPANGPAQPTVPGRGTAPTGDPFEPRRPDLPRGNAGSSRGPATPDGPSLEGPQGVTEAELPSANDGFGDPGQPVLALPEMPKPPGVRGVDSVVVTNMPSSLPPDATTVELPPMANEPPPAQAPRRPSLIGGLLNMGNWRRR